MEGSTSDSEEERGGDCFVNKVKKGKRGRLCTRAEHAMLFKVLQSSRRNNCNLSKKSTVFADAILHES